MQLQSSTVLCSITTNSGKQYKVQYVTRRKWHHLVCAQVKHILRVVANCGESRRLASNSSSTEHRPPVRVATNVFHNWKLRGVGFLSLRGSLRSVDPFDSDRKNVRSICNLFYSPPDPCPTSCIKACFTGIFAGLQVCTGIGGELMQANRALLDDPGLLSEDVRPYR